MRIFKRIIVSALKSGSCLRGDEPDAVFREIIATFLTEWLTRHVFGTDKELEAFILQSYAK